MNISANINLLSLLIFIYPVFILYFTLICQHNFFGKIFKRSREMSQSVGVFLSASDTQCERFRTLAHNVGKALAQLGLSLIYGGVFVGLMGVLAKGALE